jgi:hypothetical protein
VSRCALGRSSVSRLFVVAVLVLATVTACGGSSHPSGVPASSLSQGDQEMVSFTRCMRIHGIHMRDPYRRPGNTGLTLDLPTATPAVRPALNACNHLLAQVNAEKAAGAAARAASDLPSLIRYARCMRAHDIAMPDPGPNGALDLGRVPGITASYGRHSTQFRTADGACRHLLPASVHDDGTGP